MQISIEEGNKLIHSFMGRKPEEEYYVGNGESICYSPGNMKEYYPMAFQQKKACDDWLAGLKPDSWPIQQGYKTMKCLNYPYYNSNWNVLMEVVEKLCDMGFDVDISQRWCCIDGEGYFGDSSGTMQETTIMTVWEQISNCIEWYNTNKEVTP